jgi:negative regulator of flagellin synthesis FlgM
MNINNNTKGISAKEIQQYMLNESLGKEKEVQGDKTAAIPQEKVDISDKAREIQQTTTAMNVVPDVREEKVQALKSQIDNGTYKVSSEELAKKLVGESLLDIFV